MYILQETVNIFFICMIHFRKIVRHQFCNHLLPVMLQNHLTILVGKLDYSIYQFLNVCMGTSSSASLEKKTNQQFLSGLMLQKKNYDPITTSGDRTSWEGISSLSKETITKFILLNLLLNTISEHLILVNCTLFV